MSSSWAGAWVCSWYGLGWRSNLVPNGLLAEVTRRLVSCKTIVTACLVGFLNAWSGWFSMLQKTAAWFLRRWLWSLGIAAAPAPNSCVMGHENKNQCAWFALTLIAWGG
mgnify:CR=1 FL=1